MSATLGGLIKDFRTQKNISQIEIAFAMGWKEPSRLSRIEQGKVGKPDRELMDRIIEALNLSEEERNQLLAAGGYLPTKEEIKQVRQKMGQVIDSWPYPASMRDYLWRIVYTNKSLYKLFKIPLKRQVEMEKNCPWVIEEIFKPGFVLNKINTPKEWKKRKEHLLRTLVHFQYKQKAWSREKWYLDLIKRMMENELFRELWPLAQNHAADPSDIFHFGQKSIPCEGKMLNFRFFIVPVFRDPRFMVEFFVPSDLKTHQYFEK